MAHSRGRAARTLAATQTNRDAANAAHSHTVTQHPRSRRTQFKDQVAGVCAVHDDRPAQALRLRKDNLPPSELVRVVSAGVAPFVHWHTLEDRRGVGTHKVERFRHHVRAVVPLWRHHRRTRRHTTHGDTARARESLFHHVRALFGSLFDTTEGRGGTQHTVALRFTGSRKIQVMRPRALFFSFTPRATR